MYNIPKMHVTASQIKHGGKEITPMCDKREDFNQQKWHSLVIFNEIITWWGSRAKLWRKAGKEESRKKILKKKS